MGGWLSVRGPLRYSRISAGMMDKDADSHFGQTMDTPLDQKQQTAKKNKLQGIVNSNWLRSISSTEYCPKMKHPGGNSSFVNKVHLTA